MLGVLMNPVAGIGGPAGLSGSDGADIQQLAREKGARSRVHERAVRALSVVAAEYPELTVLVPDGSMGAAVVHEVGLRARVVYEPGTPTSPDDTAAAVRALAAAGVTLIMFAGGDGTARVVAEALVAVNQHRREGERVAAIGIPAGVKMYSGAFAVGPQAAGAVAAEWCAAGAGQIGLIERDVLDVDEAALREARVAPKLYGTMPVPALTARTQARKTSTPAGERAAIQAAARGLVANMRPGTRYALGPGGTMQEVARLLGHEKKPLGVDVVQDGRVLAVAASEEELLELLPRGSRIVLSVIGGQGFVLGRGNQQISARVLAQVGREAIMVVAPEQKLIDLQGRPLLVDTGHADVDAMLSGAVTVTTGARTKSLYRVRAADL